MPVIIQDDFWEAAELMSRKAAGEFLLAVVRFGMTGELPEGHPSWLPTFTTVKGRVSMSADRRSDASEKAKRAANARWGRRTRAADAPADADDRMHAHDADACADDASSNADAMHAHMHEHMHEHADAYAHASDAHDADACADDASSNADALPESESEINPPSKSEGGFSARIVPDASAFDAHASDASATDASAPRPFSPPTPEEVEAYARASTMPAFDAGAFVDHYAAVGWVMPNGRPVRDWHALARSWARRQPEFDRRDAGDAAHGGRLTADDFADYR